VKVTILASYAYLRDQPDELIERLVCDPRVEFLVDSGAFTAFNSGKEVVLAEYMAWLHRWRSHLFGYMALDKLQDPIQTDANLSIMLADGLKPIPIHVFGDDEKRMDWLFEQSEWVALGGLRRPHRGAAPVEYVKQKMAWAKGRRVHWLGYTSQTMIKGFRPFSVDCANLKAGPMYGQLHLYAGGGQMVTVLLDEWQSRKQISGFDHRKLRAMVTKNGLPPERFDNPASWRSQKAVQPVHEVNARSWVHYSTDVRASVGTRLFLATIAAQAEMDAGYILSAVDFAENVGWLDRESVPATGGEP
jgi:hypothetical protein